MGTRSAWCECEACRRFAGKKSVELRERAALVEVETGAAMVWEMLKKMQLLLSGLKRQTRRICSVAFG